MLITKSDELKSKMNTLFSLLESDDDDFGGAGEEMELINIGECVGESKEITLQLRKEVSSDSWNIVFGLSNLILLEASG